MSAYAPTDVVKIDAHSGMVNLPQQTNYGVSVSTLLNPIIGRGAAIQIDNRSIQRARFTTTPSGENETYTNRILATNLTTDGVYKVFAVQHQGDTRGNDWYSRAECIAADLTNPGRRMIPDQSILTLI